MRMVVIASLLCLSACKPPSREDQLGKVLVKWDGAKCTAFLSERGWAPHEEPRVDEDGSVKCEGTRNDEHVILNINHAFTKGKASDAAALFEPVKYSVKAFGTVYVQTRQSARKPAETLRDACVAAGRFDAQGLRACMTKQGWVFDDADEDACVSSESSTRCDATKKQVYGRAAASIYAESLGDAAEEQRAYRFGSAEWSLKEWSLSVKVDDYDATREWMLELEKAAATDLPKP